MARLPANEVFEMMTEIELLQLTTLLLNLDWFLANQTVLMMLIIVVVITILH